MAGWAPWEKASFVIPGERPLLKAVKNNNLNEVQSLISQGADPNEECLISEAASLGHSEMVKLLIDNGANVNCNRYSTYPILQAVHSKDIKSLKILIEHGADLTVRNNQLANVLMEAARLNNFEAVRFLITLGGGLGVNAKDRQGRTAVYHSVTSNPINLRTTKILLEHGAILDHLEDYQFRKLIREGTRIGDPEIRNFFTEFVKQAKSREYNRVLTRGSVANPNEPSLANLPDDVLELISRKAAGLSFGTSEIRYLRNLITIN
jgi:ankyrin repeat protein